MSSTSRERVGICRQAQERDLSRSASAPAPLRGIIFICLLIFVCTAYWRVAVVFTQFFPESGHNIIRCRTPNPTPDYIIAGYIDCYSIYLVLFLCLQFLSCFVYLHIKRTMTRLYFTVSDLCLYINATTNRCFISIVCNVNSDISLSEQLP